MVHNCAIISCPLHNRRNIRKGLLFHSFPVDQHRFELWRQTVFNHCSQTLSINRHSKICYRHFLPDDYIANHTGLTRYLKATAIPSVFTDTHSSRTLFNDQLLGSCTTLSSSRNQSAPSKSSSSTLFASNAVGTKAKRLLNTIDKLHQIQNANKAVGASKPDLEEPNDIPTGNSVSLSRILSIDHPNESQPSSRDTSRPPSLETNALPSPENTAAPTPKSNLNDVLFEFLAQANLLQYYPAFIEQGGDDLKQLAEAQNNDFEEIVTLVGMASKPLHIKRFKKALADYRQTTSNFCLSNTFLCGPIASPLSDRPLFSPRSLSTSTKSPVPANWNSSKIDVYKTNGGHQLLDDSQRKLIADEAERVTNLLPLSSIKMPNGRNHISKDLFATIHLPRDFEDRWQRIRKYSAIYNRFDSPKPNEAMSLHEILINEAAAAICFHRPEFLTRRDELLQLARRVLQNIGVSTNSLLKRPLSMLTCNVVPPKQGRLLVSSLTPMTRQRDTDTFRLMWHNRETKLEQIPIEIETLRREQNKLLQQLKQNTMDSTQPIDNNALKKHIDGISKKIEQLSDEEKNLRRLIRKKNMRLRAKERQQQKQLITSNLPTASSDSMLPTLPATPLLDFKHDDTPHDVHIKEEQVELPLNLTSPVLKARRMCEADFVAKPIDRRRDEVNDRSTTTTNDSIVNNSQTLSTDQHEEDIAESKSFIHNLDFTMDILNENE